jgi:hypothetical protein
MKVSQTALEAITIPEKGLNARLSCIQRTDKNEEFGLEGHFFYLTLRDTKPTTDEFVDFIYGRIIDFCLPGYEIRKMHLRAKEIGNSAYVEAMEKARRVFIKALKLQNTTGELGELILYVLLETVIKAPQLVAKMTLKTSRDMPVHGSDGIHVRFDDASDNLHLIWGESKLYQRLSSALNSAISSISDFEKGNSDKKSRDIDIIRQHSSLTDDSIREPLMKYFDPYESVSNDVINFHACFFGFDSELYNSEEGDSDDRLEKRLKSRYEKDINKTCEYFKQKIGYNDLHHLKFILFLLPFKDVSELRRKFLDRLGVKTCD